MLLTYRSAPYLWGILALGLLVAGSLSPVFAQDADAALAQFDQLPSAQKQQILQRIGGRSQIGEQQAPDDPDVVTPTTSDTGAESGQSSGSKRFTAHDALVITIRGGDLDSPLVRDLQGKRFLNTDREGRLTLYGIGTFSVAGLTPRQAALRLNAEPLLSRADISIELLPIQPSGAAALRPFGYDLFSGRPSTFAPATRIPVPQDYVLGPGDVLKLTMFGNTNEEVDLAVDRNGDIYIAGIGPMNVSGRRFEEVRQDIQTRINEQRIGVSTSVTLDRLRSIRVFVLGESANPGAYTISSLSTLTHALYVSGGVMQSGSLRAVQLKRRGRIVRTLDLYDLLLDGDTRNDIQLQPDDVVFIPPLAKTFAIYGEVTRPAIYEFRGRADLDSALRLAGGTTATANPNQILIHRTDADGARVIREVTAANSTASVTNGDQIEVTRRVPTADGTVTLRGHVADPGPREWRAGLRVSDLLRGQVLPRAEQEYALIVDPTGQRRAVSFRLTDALSPSLRNTAADPLVRAGDQVIVFDRTGARSALVSDVVEQAESVATFGAPAQTVSVVGRVRFPGAYPREPGMTVADLLRAAGGLTQDAYGLSADLLRKTATPSEVNEQIESIDLMAVLEGRSNETVLPRDTLIVRQLPGWRETIRVEVEGEVVFPGQYVVKEGDTLADLVARAGGTTPLAYADAAIFMRDSLRAREAAELAALQRRVMQQVTYLSVTRPEDAIGSTPADLQRVRAILQESRESEVTGRLVIDLAEQLQGSATSVITLLDGDRLVIPRKPTTVTVIGEAQFPSSHVFRTGATVRDYVGEAGGVSELGDEKKIYVIRANGRVERARSGWFSRDLVAMPGDTIVVPLDLNRNQPLEFWSTVAQILYQTALTVAAFKTVGAF